MNLYRVSTAVVHPAFSEGYSVTLQEAMALGTPVIAAAADGPSELINHGKNGLLVPIKDTAALADAILSLLNDPVLARGLSETGFRDAEDAKIETMVERTSAVYRETLATHLRSHTTQTQGIS